MIILTASRFDIERFLQWGIQIAAAFIAIAFGALLFLWLWPSGSSLLNQEQNDKRAAMAGYLYPLEAIGNGPLALHPRIACGWVSRIAEEFSVIGFNSRPDVQQEEAKILIALRGEKEQTIVGNGKVIHLQEQKEGKGLTLSKTESSLWVKPMLLDNGSVLIEAGRRLLSKEGALLGEEKGEFIASPAGNVVGRTTDLRCLTELKSAKYIGQDPLILKYGGKEYASWKDKIKVEFSSELRSYAVFISSGDLLQYQRGEWRVISSDKINADLPVARATLSGPNMAMIEGWDESGMHQVEVKCEALKNAPTPLNHDQLPSSLRLRNETQVSCLFGKRRVVLKKGDWLLRTSSGWRTLKRAEEIEDCLFHRLKGELLIFDRIEKQQGKYVLQGHLFDSLRKSMTPVALPIDIDKKPAQRTHKKNKQPFSRGSA